jgi:hypothetical protein
MVLKRDLRLRRLTLIGVILYTGVLAFADFEHHDFACHFKTPQHCTACSIGAVGSEPGRSPAPAESGLTDAGQIDLVHDRAATVLLPVRTRDRSPPPLA